MKTTLILLLIATLIMSGWAIYEVAKLKNCIQHQIIINRCIIDKSDWRLAIAHVKKYEGFRSVFYVHDHKSYIGYGHQIQKDEIYLHEQPITENHAEKLLIQDLEKCLLYANWKFKLTGNKALAIALFMYQHGQYYLNDKELGKELLKGSANWDENHIKNEWMRYRYFKGAEHPRFVERRQFEIELFTQK